MGTVTALTAARMIAIEASSVVSGVISGNNLILTKHDGSTIDAGNVRGPTGSPGVTLSEYNSGLATVNASIAAANTKIDDNTPIGVVDDYMGTVAPNSKWLLIVGQTVANAQTLYPTWWGLIPASMKSGSSALMPDTRKCVTVGYDATDTDFNAIGKAGGSKTHTLTQAQLPAATITIDPPLTNVNITQAPHGHGYSADDLTPFYIVGTNQGYGYFWGYPTVSSRMTNADYAQITGASVDIAPFASGALGSGASHPIVQPYVTFCKMVKVL